MTQVGETRIERDSLGEVRVPAGALWGAQTQRALDNFPISGLRPWPAFIWAMAAIKRSAADVHKQLGLLDPALADAIAASSKEIMNGNLREQFVVDPFQAGAGTSHNMNTNEVIANRATLMLGGKLGEYRVHPNDHVNMSQSTNDTIPTAIRLGCLWRSEELFATLQRLAAALRAKSVEFDHIVKSGRTHLQDAVPVRLGQEFAGYARAVERDVDRLRRAADGLRRLGIGGTAAGSGLNAHPRYHAMMVERLTAITGLQLSTSDDLFECMQSMADAADFSAAMRTTALTLTRIANDIRLLASGPTSGFDEIRLPPVQPGSSIMPGKINPSMVEMLNQAMFHLIGCDTCVAYSSQAGQLELNVMMPIIAHNLFEMMQVMIGSVAAFTERAIVGLQANPEKAAAWLAKNPIVVTALNPVIGYAAGAALVKEALVRNLAIRELALEKIGRGELMHRDQARAVSIEEIDAALSDLRRLTEGGITGAPAAG
jgi:fumarate hydratase class II